MPLSDPRIYLADDEPELLRLVSGYLAAAGLSVETFPTGDALWGAFSARPADVVVLDIMMPGTPGDEVAAHIREVSDVPIVLLTAKDADDDQCAGLALGADDYVTKPFNPRLLTARVQALLRRQAMTSAPKTPEAPLTCGNVSFDPASKRCSVAGRPLALSPTEAQLLAYYLARPGEAVARKTLLEEVWGFPEGVGSRAADEANRRLRKKLLAAGADAYNRTVWGFGFTFAPEEEP